MKSPVKFPNYNANLKSPVHNWGWNLCAYRLPSCRRRRVGVGSRRQRMTAASWRCRSLRDPWIVIATSPRCRAEQPRLGLAAPAAAAQRWKDCGKRRCRVPTSRPICVRNYVWAMDYGEGVRWPAKFYGLMGWWTICVLNLVALEIWRPRTGAHFAPVDIRGWRKAEAFGPAISGLGRVTWLHVLILSSMSRGFSDGRGPYTPGQLASRLDGPDLVCSLPQRVHNAQYVSFFFFDLKKSFSSPQLFA